MEIENIINSQREWSASVGLSYKTDLRADALDRLGRAIKAHESKLAEALNADLGKSATEAYMTEIGLTLSELRVIRKHIHRWSHGKEVRTPLSNFPARSLVYREPYGVVLIMVPWNYPVLLALDPLIGAIAAGNTVIMKFSPYATHSAVAVKEVVAEVFDTNHVAVLDDKCNDFLKHRYDYIFFTGSPATGRVVMRAAAEHLTPVTLELGGKSPCIVHESADIKLAARRIVFGKFINCGQTCVAPDYILADRKIANTLTAAIIREITRQYGSHAFDNDSYGRIINQGHFDRITRLINPDKVAYGGGVCRQTMQIEPTVMTGVDASDAVMQEEIFGPLLPIVEYDSVDEAIEYVARGKSPLALYLFANDRTVERRVMKSIKFGGGCVNDTIMHLTSPYLPFGGVGESGMGAYHGRYSYSTFSREKSVVYKNRFVDIPLRYQPFSTLKDRLIRLFLR